MSKFSTLIFTTLLALLLVNCSSKSNEPTVDPLPKKKLVKVETLNYSALLKTTHFIYEGHTLAGYRVDQFGEVGETHKYEYEGNTIWDKSQRVMYKYVRDSKNRIIEKTRYDEERPDTRDLYNYSDAGYLDKVITVYIDEKTQDESPLYYKGGNLASIEYANTLESFTEIKVEYTEHNDLLGLNVIPTEFEMEYVFTDFYATVFPSQIFYQLGMYGKKSKKLVSRVGELRYEYKFDADGFVTHITQRGKQNGVQTGIDYRLYYDK